MSTPIQSRSIRFLCRQCGKRHEAPACFAGRRSRCGRCKTEFRVPTPEDQPSADLPPSQLPLSAPVSVIDEPPLPAREPASGSIMCDRCRTRTHFGREAARTGHIKCGWCGNELSVS